MFTQEKKQSLSLFAKKVVQPVGTDWKPHEKPACRTQFLQRQDRYTRSSLLNLE